MLLRFPAVVRLRRREKVKTGCYSYWDACDMWEEHNLITRHQHIKTRRSISGATFFLSCDKNEPPQNKNKTPATPLVTLIWRLYADSHCLLYERSHDFMLLASRLYVWVWIRCWCHKLYQLEAEYSWIDKCKSVMRWYGYILLVSRRLFMNGDMMMFVALPYICLSLPRYILFNKALSLSLPLPLSHS